MSRKVSRLTPAANRAASLAGWNRSTALAAALLAAACSGGGGGSGSVDTTGTACDGAFTGGATRVVTDRAVVEYIPLTSPDSSSEPWMAYNLDAGCMSVRQDYHAASASFTTYSVDLSTRPPRIASENALADQLKALAGQDAYWVDASDRNVEGDIGGAYIIKAAAPYGGIFVYDGIGGPLSLGTMPDGFVGHSLINSSRTMAGSYADPSNVMHGFVRYGGTTTVLDYPESLVPTVIWGGYAVATHAINGTHVTGLNDAGKVVGWADLDLAGPSFVAPGFHQPFVYDVASGTWSNFQFDPSASSGAVRGNVTPEGITSAGDVYGEWNGGPGWSGFYQFAATGAVVLFNHPDGGYTTLVAGHADRIVVGTYLTGSPSVVKPFMARITDRSTPGVAASLAQSSSRPSPRPME